MGSCSRRHFLLSICFLQTISIIERQVFDFLGYMWAPILANFFHIIFVIFGFYGSYLLSAKYLITYLIWNIIWMGWNAFLICFYMDVGILDKNSDILNLGTGSVSWFEVNGYGCKPTYPTNITSEDPYRPVRPEHVDDCLIDYPIVEVIHSSIQFALSILALIGAISIVQIFIDEDDRFDFMGGDAKSPQHTSVHPMYVSYSSIPTSASATMLSSPNKNNNNNNNNSKRFHNNSINNIDSKRKITNLNFSTSLTSINQNNNSDNSNNDNIITNKLQQNCYGQNLHKNYSSYSNFTNRPDIKYTQILTDHQHHHCTMNNLNENPYNNNNNNDNFMSNSSNLCFNTFKSDGSSIPRQQQEQPHQQQNSSYVPFQQNNPVPIKFIHRNEYSNNMNNMTKTIIVPKQTMITTAIPTSSLSSSSKSPSTSLITTTPTPTTVTTTFKQNSNNRHPVRDNSLIFNNYNDNETDNLNNLVNKINKNAKQRQSFYSIEFAPVADTVRGRREDHILNLTDDHSGQLSPKPMTPRRVKRRSVMTRGTTSRQSNVSRRSHSNSNRNSIRNSRRKYHQNPVTKLIDQQHQNIKPFASFSHTDNSNLTASNLKCLNTNLMINTISGGGSNSNTGAGIGNTGNSSGGVNMKSSFYNNFSNSVSPGGSDPIYYNTTTSTTQLQQSWNSSNSPTVMHNSNNTDGGGGVGGHFNPTYQHSTPNLNNSSEHVDDFYNNRPPSVRSSYSNFHGTRPLSSYNPTTENVFVGISGGGGGAGGGGSDGSYGVGGGSVNGVSNILPANIGAVSQPQVPSSTRRTASRESIRSMAFLNNGPPAYNLNYHTPPDSETTM